MFLDLVRIARTIARTIARKACAAGFSSTVNVFPALYSCENWHEHSIGHGLWLEGLGLRLLSAQHAQLRAQRAQRALLAPSPCFLFYRAVIIGINIQLDVADVLRVFEGLWVIEL